MTLYIENIPEEATAADLAALFAPFGRVTSAEVAVSRDTGEGLGSAFVEMDRSDGNDAIAGLDGVRYRDRTLSVVEALPLDDTDLLSEWAQLAGSDGVSEKGRTR
jgi:RNA recognition motif-containing protein